MAHCLSLGASQVVGEGTLSSWSSFTHSPGVAPSQHSRRFFPHATHVIGHDLGGPLSQMPFLQGLQCIGLTSHPKWLEASASCERRVQGAGECVSGRSPPALHHQEDPMGSSVLP